MPELPEVEILARHLNSLLKGKTIRYVEIHRTRSIRPGTPKAFSAKLKGAKLLGVHRRAKYLVFEYRKPKQKTTGRFLGHLGMSGRMYLQKRSAPLPRHVVAVFDLGRLRFIFEDTRYFGKLTLDTTALKDLGPEPLEEEFQTDYLSDCCANSARPIKSLLMEQSIVAGLGNIYANEALFCAGISPRKKSRRLSRPEVNRLHAAIRNVLSEAIELGSTLSLKWEGGKNHDRLFYFGSNSGDSNPTIERFRVYDREGEPCVACGKPIRRIVQSNRGTFFCPSCQRA